MGKMRFYRWIGGGLRVNFFEVSLVQSFDLLFTFKFKRGFEIEGSLRVYRNGADS